MRTALVLGLIVSLIAYTNAANDCFWLFSAYEGIPAVTSLVPQWNCSGIITITPLSPTLQGFVVPNIRQPTVQYTPPTGGVAVGTQSQKLSITCDIFTPMCNTATVWYVVRPSSLTTPPTTTTTTAVPQTTTTTAVPTVSLAPGMTGAPTTTTTTTSAPTATPTTTPAPTPSLPVTCTAPPTLITNLTQAVNISLWANVANCVSPSLTFSDNSSSTLFSIAANILVFDSCASNTVQGVYTAKVSISCGGALVCFLTQNVVAVAPPMTTAAPVLTPAPSLYASCVPVYGYEAIFSSPLVASVANMLGSSTCPNASSTLTYLLLSGPAVNAANFTLDPFSGAFSYLAPSVMTADVFSFALVCDNLILCTTNAYLITASSGINTGAPTLAPTTGAPTATPVTPIPTTVPLPPCIGSYSYTFYTNTDGTFTPQQANLFTSAAANFSGSLCSLFANATLTSSPVYGTVAFADATTGIFTYGLPGPVTNFTDWDNFTFVLTCSTTSYQCQGTAFVLLLPPPVGPTQAPTPVPTQAPTEYRIGSITCSGTCSSDAFKVIDIYKAGFDITTDMYGGYSQVTPRSDGRPLDSMFFYLRDDGMIVFIALSKIGNMAVRFPTFSPVSSSSLLTSANALQSNAAFDPTCLDNQGRFGVANALWNWTNMSALQGQVSGNYASNKDYYQKYGGKHVNCDTFLNGACSYAPMMNPSNKSGINWKLRIQNCDATWFGEASLATIKAMRDGNGNPVFQRIGDNVLQASVFSEVIKPASWVRPTAGTLQLTTNYTIQVNVNNLLTVDVSTFSFVPVTTTTTAVPVPPTTGVPNTTAAPQVVPRPRTQTKSVNIAHLREYEEEDVNGTAGSSSASNASVAAVNITNGTSAASNSTVSNTTLIASLNVTTAAPTPLPTPVPTTPPPLFLGVMNFTADVAYTITKDVNTLERLYLYNLLLYPSIPLFSSLYVTRVRLANATFTTPKLSNCPQCTGTNISCVGNGIDLGDQCGASALVSFAAGANDTAVCVNQTVFSPVSGVANVRSCPQSLYNISVVGRVNGNGSAISIGQPEGDVYFYVDFSNGQTVVVGAHQADYISQVARGPLGSTLCRSSQYFPVVDPVGTSVATQVFVSTPASTQIDPWGLQTLDMTTPALATPLIPATSATASMCLVGDARTFGPTEWVYLQLNTVLTPNATIDFLSLRVKASEVVPSASGDFYFLLQGASPFASRQYLDWRKYASFLNFRSVDTSNGQTPFTFAFIPGTLLSPTSSMMVMFTVEAMITTPDGSSLVRYIVPVSKSINAAVRFETVLTPFINYNLASSSSSSIGRLTTNLIIGLVLIGGVFAVIAFLVYRDDEARKVFVDQLSTIGCCKAEDDEMTMGPISTATSPKSSQPKESPKGVAVPPPPTSPQRVRKALTPAAAAAQAKKENSSSVPASPQASLNQPRAASPSLRALPPPQKELPRAPHDDDVVMERKVETEPRRVTHDDE